MEIRIIALQCNRLENKLVGKQIVHLFSFLQNYGQLWYQQQNSNLRVWDASATHHLGLALAWFLCFGYHLIGDGGAVEVGAFVLFVHSDQPADERVGRWRAFRGSVLLLKHRQRFGVLATFSRQEVLPNCAIFRGDGTTSTQLCGGVLPVSSGQERPDSSARGVPRGVLPMTRFGARCFGTDAGHQPGFIGSRLWARFGGWADPVGTILQVDGELLEPLCHGDSVGNQYSSLPAATPLCAIHHRAPETHL